MEIKFSEDSFNKFFPYYILIDASLKIQSFGKSIAKIDTNISTSQSFLDYFEIKKSNIEIQTFQDLITTINQQSEIIFRNNKMTLRGQFELIDGLMLFVGNPVFDSVNQMDETEITPNDFAIHNPLLDVIEVHNPHEETSKTLNNSSDTVNLQKNKLKDEKEELVRLSLVASANKNGVFFTKPDGIIFWCNDAFLKLTGYSRKDVIGKNPIEIGRTSFTDKEDLKKMITSFYNGDPIEIEQTHGRKDGTSFWIKSKGQPVFDENGKVTQYFATIEDITKEKLSSIELKDSENRLSSLIFNLDTAILLEDVNRKIVLVNKKCCSLFGFNIDPSQLTGLDCSSSIDQAKVLFKSPTNFVKRVKTILKQKIPVYNEELELVDGRIFERNFIPILKNGKYDGYLWTYNDVTLKKRYHENLQIEKEKYRSIIANMNLGLIEVDTNDVIIMANQSFCNISGYSLEELMGKKAAKLLLSKENQKIVKEKEKLREKGEADSYEVKVKDKNNNNRRWLISGAPNYNINGKVIGSIGIHFDITEQKEQEEKLYLLSLIAEKNINAVIIADSGGKIEWVNSSF